MFRTDILPIIRSLNTVYKAIYICHTEILKVGKINSVYTYTYAVPKRRWTCTNIHSVTSQKASRSSNECSFNYRILFIRKEKGSGCLQTKQYICQQRRMPWHCI